jgi:hypothetical protein
VSLFCLFGIEDSSFVRLWWKLAVLETEGKCQLDLLSFVLLLLLLLPARLAVATHFTAAKREHRGGIYTDT